MGFRPRRFVDMPWHRIVLAAMLLSTFGGTAVLAADEPDLPVRVRGVREDGTVVIEGVIHLWVTPRT